jgi:predicted metalloprotease
MRWRGYRTSDNVEDRRGMRVPGGGMAIGGGGLLLLVVLALVTGQDPSVILDTIGQSQVSVDSGTDEVGRQGAPADEAGQFTSVVLASTEDVWNRLLPGQGTSYSEPTLVLFSGAVQSACGFASAAVGPFYCPADRKVYLDLSFFQDLERNFGAPGDFAQAYVVAHEVGHHVQRLLGISDRVSQAQQRLSRDQANALSVRLELQADCLAGVWGHHANREARMLEPGDVDEGLRAAAAIGDDRMQRRSSGTVQPESWTHGSSEMRARWLRRGLESGDPSQCDTFAAERL